MKAVYALYSDGESAQRAVNGLRAAGIADSGITVISGEPMEDFEFSEMHKDTWIWYIASAGGFAGLVAATWLTTMSETSWPISTGNMPIVSWWPNMIIMFEMTMLGAILATVITLVVSGGLLRRRPPLYDPAVTDGKILVGVEDASEASMPELERALKVHPNVLLKTITAP